MKRFLRSIDRCSLGTSKPRSQEPVSRALEMMILQPRHAGLVSGWFRHQMAEHGDDGCGRETRRGCGGGSGHWMESLAKRPLIDGGLSLCDKPVIRPRDGNLRRRVVLNPWRLARIYPCSASPRSSSLLTLGACYLLEIVIALYIDQKVPRVDPRPGGL